VAQATTFLVSSSVISDSIARASSAGRSPSAFDVQMETNGGRIQGRDKRECPYRVSGLLVRRANMRIFLTGATGVIGRRVSGSPLESEASAPSASSVRTGWTTY
jgi:hypothetical protein